jgi:hypothetical protein
MEKTRMDALRYCRSCKGPRPRAARRCPWCHRSYAEEAVMPAHLFGTFDGESDARARDPAAKGDG